MSLAKIAEKFVLDKLNLIQHGNLRLIILFFSFTLSITLYQFKGSCIPLNLKLL